MGVRRAVSGREPFLQKPTAASVSCSQPNQAGEPYYSRSSKEGRKPARRMILPAQKVRVASELPFVLTEAADAIRSRMRQFPPLISGQGSLNRPSVPPSSPKLPSFLVLPTTWGVAWERAGHPAQSRNNGTHFMPPSLPASPSSSAVNCWSAIRALPEQLERAARPPVRNRDQGELPQIRAEGSKS